MPVRIQVSSVSEIRAELRKRAPDWGDARRLAEQCHVSAPLMCQVMNGSRGNRSINPKILKALGYDPTPYYRKRS